MFRWRKRSSADRSEPKQPPTDLRCSFCNKTQAAVRKLIAGPTVFICDECVQVCVDIMADDARHAALARDSPADSTPMLIVEMDRLASVLVTLLRELVDGAGREAAWMLNPQDAGLLRSLDTLSAAAASARAHGDGSSIAAHVDHLCYGLELLNRWSRGENPFGDANYSASWRRQTVTNQEWAALRERLRSEAESWMQAVRQPRDLTDTELTGVISSIAHLAYHLGAIRQIDRSTRGPTAAD